MSNPFNVINNSVEEIEVTNKEIDLKEQIETLLKSGTVVLFMKGNADFPQCGFSANSVAILKHLAVPFKTFNILNDPEVRHALKSILTRQLIHNFM